MRVEPVGHANSNADIGYATPTPTPSAAFVVLGRSFPSAETTGVPTGITLSKYTGNCLIQKDNFVIDAKIVNCDLRVFAHDVTITRSQINGSVYADAEAGEGSFTISDSWVNNANADGTGIGDSDFTAIRVHVTGGSRSINCYRDCTVQDSYVHGQYTDPSGRAHESGIRMGSNSVLRGNTIGCTAPDRASRRGMLGCDHRLRRLRDRPEEHHRRQSHPRRLRRLLRLRRIHRW